jgi:hypothetical protein
MDEEDDDVLGYYGYGELFFFVTPVDVVIHFI